MFIIDNNNHNSSTKATKPVQATKKLLKRLLNFFLDLQEKAENSSISVLKIMSSKNACAREFACILGRNIKCSVIIIIITHDNIAIALNYINSNQTQ